MKPRVSYKRIVTMSFFRILPILALFALIALKGKGQIDRSQAPEPGPPPEINLEDPYSFTLDNGLKVFVVEDHTVPMLSFYLRLDHEPVLEGKKTGYVGMTGSMLDKGTENRSRQDIAKKVDGMGASLNTSGSYIYAESLRQHSSELLKVMADVLMNPTFPKEQLKKVKKRQKSSIRQQTASSRSILRNVSKSVTYGDEHPYGEVTTTESVDKINVKDLKEHYRKFWRPGVSYLAVVGDVKPKKAEKMIRSHFAEWKNRDVPSKEYDQPKAPSENKVALAHKDGAAQASLSFTYPVKLKPGDKDLLPAKVMNSLLGGSAFSSRLFKNLREDKGYTYGVYSGLSEDPLVGRFFAGGNVSQMKADSSIIQIRKELQKLKKGGINKKELKDHKQIKSGSFTRSLENPQNIARYAINIDRYDLPKDHYKNYLKRLDQVSKKEVDRAAKKYLKPDNAHIVVVGSKDSLKGQLGEFGPVQRYDAFGKEKEKEKEVKTSEDLTAEKVLKRYEEALGGKKAIEKVNEIERVYEGSMRGRTITRKNIYEHEEPGFFGKLFGKEATTKAIEISKGGRMSKVLLDGSNVYVSQGGQKDTLSGKDLKERRRAMGQLFPKRNYLEDGCKVELLGSEMVDGEKAAVLRVTNLKGESHKEFYSLESGLILQEVTERSMRGRTFKQTVSYHDYQEHGPGVKIPSKLKIDIGGRITITLEQKKVKINHGVPDDTFKL